MKKNLTAFNEAFLLKNGTVVTSSLSKCKTGKEIARNLFSPL